MPHRTSLAFMLALSLAAGPAAAQSSEAYENANCNASFQAGCGGETTVAEAPLPIAGIPAALALVFLAGAAARRRHATRG